MKVTNEDIARLFAALERLVPPAVPPSEDDAFMYWLMHKLREDLATTLKVGAFGGMVGEIHTIFDENEPYQILMNCFSWYTIADGDPEKEGMIGEVYNKLRWKGKPASMHHQQAEKSDRIAMVAPSEYVPPPIPSTEHRLRNEMEIIKKFWELAFENGCCVAAVYDGEEVCEVPTFEAAWSVISAVDQSSLYFKFLRHTGSYDSFELVIILGNGNNGFDVISDMSVGEHNGAWLVTLTQHSDWLEDREERFNETGQLP